jgi:hypothetical protein
MGTPNCMRILLNRKKFVFGFFFPGFQSLKRHLNQARLFSIYSVITSSGKYFCDIASCFVWFNFSNFCFTYMKRPSVQSCNYFLVNHAATIIHWPLNELVHNNLFLSQCGYHQVVTIIVCSVPFTFIFHKCIICMDYAMRGLFRPLNS